MSHTELVEKAANISPINKADTSVLKTGLNTSSSVHFSVPFSVCHLAKTLEMLLITNKNFVLMMNGTINDI